MGRAAGDARGLAVEETRSGGHPGAVARIRGRLRAVSPWTWGLVALCTGHAAWFSYLQVDAHLGFGTFAYDVGLYDQGLWLLSRGHAPFVTLMGRNLFGDHSSLILFLLVPLYWVIPGTPTLLVVQACVVASGAVPIYLFARQKLGSGALAIAAAVIWLANPAVLGANMENFHPDTFLGLFVPLALYAAFNRRWGLYVIAVGLSLLVKEDVVLLVAPLGVYVAATIDRRRGLWTILAGLCAALLAMYGLMRSLSGVPTRNTWRIPFGGVTGLLREALVRPRNVLEYLLEDQRPLYAWQMIAPLAATFVLSPGIAAIAVPVLLSNVISTFWYQHSIQYHYSIVAVPALVFAMIVGASRLARRGRALVVVTALLASLSTSVAWGQHPLSLNPRQLLSARTPVAVAGREIIKRIPADAVISVYDPLTTHLAHRREVYFFPNPFRAVYYGVDDSLSGTRLPAADRVDFVVLPRYLGPDQEAYWAPLRPGFVEVASNAFWQVFAPRER